MGKLGEVLASPHFAALPPLHHFTQPTEFRCSVCACVGAATVWLVQSPKHTSQIAASSVMTPSLMLNGLLQCRQIAARWPWCRCALLPAFSRRRFSSCHLRFSSFVNGIVGFSTVVSSTYQFGYAVAMVRCAPPIFVMYSVYGLERHFQSKIDP